MAIWFISSALDAAAQSEYEEPHAQEMPISDASGLPSLARVESAGDIKAWLRAALPQATPEHINAKADYLWTLSHVVGENDYILTEMAGGGHYRLGEVSGLYRYDAESRRHLLPVQWMHARLETPDVALFCEHFRRGAAVEITDPDVISKLRRHIPSLRRRGPIIFRWIAIATLVSELVYFWPR